MHKAVGSNIVPEFEEKILLKILNAFHLRQDFYCTKNFKATVSIKFSTPLWLSTNSDRSHATFTFTFMHLADAFIQSDLQCIQVIHLYCQYLYCYYTPLPPTCCRFYSQTFLHIFTAQMYTSLVIIHINKTCFHRN